MFHTMYVMTVIVNTLLSTDVQQFAEALQTEIGGANSSESAQSDKPKEEDTKNDKMSTSDENDKDSSA